MHAALVMLALFALCAPEGVYSHFTMGLQHGEGIDSSGAPSLSRSAYGKVGGYGFLVEGRIAHSNPGMYTYKIEIRFPSVGVNKVLSHIKPAPIPGFILKYDASSSDPKLNGVITYTALPGRELYDGWSIQIPMNLAINCGVTISDPLVVACGQTDKGSVSPALLFPAVQYVCVKSSTTSDCVPNNQTVKWVNYQAPDAFTPDGSCNAATESPATAIKFFQASVTDSCPSIVLQTTPFVLPVFDSAGSFLSTSLSSLFLCTSLAAALLV